MLPMCPSAMIESKSIVRGKNPSLSFLILLEISNFLLSTLIEFAKPEINNDFIFSLSDNAHQ